jgi:hypothetical protein
MLLIATDEEEATTKKDEKVSRAKAEPVDCYYGTCGYLF